MVKILIPRSDSISAKTIVPTDFEKYFDNIVGDYVIQGFTVTGSAGGNRSVDVTSGTARLSGTFVENDSTETTAHTFGSDTVHYLYITLDRDGNSEPESWSYSSNTTGVVPVDSMMIAKVTCSLGDVTAVDQTEAFKATHHLHTYVGTGADINALSTTYSGQIVYCIVSGSGFNAGINYIRNEDNTAWESISTVVANDTFKSTEQTGTGSQQSIAHGLGRTPTLVIPIITENTTGNNIDIAEGTHDSTNIYITAPSTMKYKVVAF